MDKTVRERQTHFHTTNNSSVLYHGFTVTEYWVHPHPLRVPRTTIISVHMFLCFLPMTTYPTLISWTDWNVFCPWIFSYSIHSKWQIVGRR